MDVDREFLERNMGWILAVASLASFAWKAGALGALMWALQFGKVLDSETAWTVWQWLAGLLAVWTLFVLWRGDRFYRDAIMNRFDKGGFR